MQQRPVGSLDGTPEQFSEGIMRPKPLISRTLLIVAPFALAIAALAGCSQSPTAPVTSPLSARVSNVPPDQVTTQTPSAAPGRTVDPVGEPAAQNSSWLNPASGGVVSAGQFHVVVPPGALRQRALVTVRQPRLDQRLVELEVSPRTANGFSAPVLLVADCPDMAASLLSTQTIWWWNADDQRWVAVANVQISLSGHTLIAPLGHFSTYMVGGKAGWKR